SIDALIESLQDFPGAFLIVTHNEGILRALATKLIVFHRGKVDVFDTSYDEFLEKIGWEDEDEGHGKANGVQNKPTTRSHHDEQKQRAKVERKEKARIEKLEAQIIKNETALKKYNEQLVLEANRNNFGQMRELSVKISQVKREIDDLYGQYSE
ncbi:MAG: ABC transporter ATP-binding protein, partial [Candidatus Binatia bacterium]